MRKSRRQIWEAIGAGARIELDVNLEERGTFLFVIHFLFGVLSFLYLEEEPKHKWVHMWNISEKKKNTEYGRQSD